MSTVSLMGSPNDAWPRRSARDVPRRAVPGDDEAGAEDRSTAARAAMAGGRTVAGDAYDRFWAGQLRAAVGYAVLLLVLLTVADLGFGHLTWWRGVLWGVLAALSFVVLVPCRVAAGAGWLTSRGLLRVRRVRTDLLVSVRCPGGVSQRLVLRDALGGRVEVDPRVLAANPPLWHRLDEDLRASVACGSLPAGDAALAALSARIDRETAMSVFKVSGLG